MHPKEYIPPDNEGRSFEAVIAFINEIRKLIMTFVDKCFTEHGSYVRLESIIELEEVVFSRTELLEDRINRIFCSLFSKYQRLCQFQYEPNYKQKYPFNKRDIKGILKGYFCR